MRKIFALLAVAFGVMSCQTDVNDFGANVGGEQDVNILVSLPEATRANSALGAFENVDMTQYDIRYIFQVFNADGTANKEMQYEYSDETTVSFPVRLIPGREYNFAVWADLVENGKTTNNNYTIDKDKTLKEISLNEWAPMDETRDAYTGKWSGTFSGAQDITIPLTRPFAKLRVVTTDMKELLGVVPTKATVEYTTTYYAKFNAFAQAPVEESATAKKTHTNFDIVSYDEGDVKKTLFADYIFAKDTQEVVNFKLSVFDQSDVIIGDVMSFSTAIPVKRNNLTTIEGNILTVGDDITVKVEEEFEAEAIIIEGEYTLTANIEVDRPIVVLAGTEAVIDLNGFNIINTNASETFGEGEGIIAYGNLTIKGEGTVKGSTMAVWARGDKNATITIEGGNFEGCAEGFAKGGRSVVYASSGNVINIKGGTFKALAADKTSYANKTEGVFAALNVADNNGMINVYGGRFYKQNPAAPGTEPKAWNDAHPYGFVANGYVSVTDGDCFEVVKGVTVASKDELNAAFTNNEVNTVALNADITYNNTDATIIQKDFTIAGNGNAITAGGADSLTPSVAVMGEYDVNINNTDVIGGFIGAYFGANVTVNGGSLKFMDGMSGRNCFYSVSNNDKQSVITINNVDVNMANASGNSYLCAHGNAVIYVTGGKFYGKPAGSSNAYVKEDTLEGYTGEVIITGGEFNFDPSEWVAAGYVATQNGNVWTVSKQ